MTPQKPLAARAQITPAGLMFLAITSIGWGFNWPVTKYLLSELPPLTMRGSTGVVGAGLLALLAILRGQSLRVPREMWFRLVLAAILNVALLDDADGIGAAVASRQRGRADRLHHAGLGLDLGLADPRRAAESVARDFAGHGVSPGLAAIMGGNGFAASAEKMPGIIMRLAAPSLRGRQPSRQEIAAGVAAAFGPPPGRSESAACRWRSRAS